jgi:chromosomal replication initiator protein
MFLLREDFHISFPTIGEKLGGRDHTTVIHAVRQIDKLRASDAERDADIRLLTRQLEG